jgi:hypothetical protein
MKINSDGEVLWTRIFSGNNRDFGACIKETADDFILVSGTTASYGNGGYDIYFIKTDIHSGAMRKNPGIFPM